MFPSPIASKSVVACLALAASSGCRMTVATESIEHGSRAEAVALVDRDGDGFTEMRGDCEDDDPEVFPGAYEACDGVDNDCSRTHEACDGVDNDCFDGIDDAGACAAVRTIPLTATADVLLVLDTQRGMQPFLDLLAEHADALGKTIGGVGSDVHVGVVNMEASGELFETDQMAFVEAGQADGAGQVAKWIRSSVAGLPETAERGRGRDSVVALLIDPGTTDAGTDPRPLDVEGWVDTASDTGAEAQQGPAEGERSGSAAAFRREKAPLNIVFVSRSDDASLLGPDAFLEALDLTSTDELRRIHAIVGSGRRCSVDGVGGVVLDGASYRTLADDSGGQVSDLCGVTRADLRTLGLAIVQEGMHLVHPLPQDMNVDRPFRLSIELPTGAILDMAPASYSVDLEAGLLYVLEPQLPGSVLSLHYEQLP